MASPGKWQESDVVRCVSQKDPGGCLMEQGLDGRAEDCRQEAQRRGAGSHRDTGGSAGWRGVQQLWVRWRTLAHWEPVTYWVWHWGGEDRPGVLALGAGG